MFLHQHIGGQLLDLQLDGCSLLYRSPLSVVGSTIRGGIPICFPQFAKNGQLPKHGFVRDIPWECIEISEQTLRYSVQLTENTHPSWPYAARLEVRYAYTDDELTVRLAIENIGKTAFSFTGGLHPYFKVNHVQFVHIEGLTGFKTDNLYSPRQSQLKANKLEFNANAFETCFEGCPDLFIYEENELKLQLNSEGFTHWMVWNPGMEGARMMKDLPHDDWQRFICVEPIVRNPITLQVGAMFKGILNVKKY